MQIYSLYNSNINYKINTQKCDNVAFGQTSKHIIISDSKTGSYIKSLYEKLKNLFKHKIINSKEENLSEPIFRYINKTHSKNGTILPGAKPLSKFWDLFNEIEKNEILQKGISTNDIGDAYALLKSNSDIPLSTSFVADCSVVYLFNKSKQTHFLYHLYPEMPKNEFLEVLEKFVSEGYSKACIVPGDNYYKECHESYLPQIIELLRKREPNATIKIYHSITPMPEIVGYKGNIYEIENKNYDGYHDCGQASFKISNILSYQIFHKIGKCKTKEDVEKLRTELRNEKYDETINKVIEDMLKVIE